MLKKYGIWILLGLLLFMAVIMKGFRAGTPAFEEEAAQEQAQQAEERQGAQALPAQEQDYFEAFRAERESIREQEMLYLDDVIATGGLGDETLAQAVEQKLALVENMEAEFAIENMIAAKGFADCAVTFHNGSVNVVVGAQELSEAEVAQILDIVRRQTGQSAQNVRVTTGGLQEAIY